MGRDGRYDRSAFAHGATGLLTTSTTRLPPFPPLPAHPPPALSPAPNHFVELLGPRVRRLQVSRGVTELCWRLATERVQYVQKTWVFSGDIRVSSNKL